MSDGQWHYTLNGAPQAPVAGGVLKQMAREGRLQPGDLVWRDGMSKWVAAGTVAGLFHPAAPPPSMAPPPIPVAPIGYYAGPAPGSGPRDIGQDPGMRWLMPVGRSGWAIAAGYLGLLSFCVIPAPFALLFSIIAIKDIKKHPDRHGMGRAIFGLIMGILGTGVLLVGLCRTHAALRFGRRYLSPLVYSPTIQNERKFFTRDPQVWL